MDEKALLEAMMLDEADLAVLAPDLAEIAGMIGRAAAATAELTANAAPAETDAGLRMVPESDPEMRAGDGSSVPLRHEIAVSGMTVPAGVLCVPRVVGGGEA